MRITIISAEVKVGAQRSADFEQHGCSERSHYFV